jgi:hypothetical protein
MAFSVNELARLPRWILVLRISQGVLTSLVLILTAYAASVFGSRAVSRSTPFLPGTQ